MGQFTEYRVHKDDENIEVNLWKRKCRIWSRDRVDLKINHKTLVLQF